LHDLYFLSLPGWAIKEFFFSLPLLPIPLALHDSIIKTTKHQSVKNKILKLKMKTSKTDLLTPCEAEDLVGYALSVAG
jgi:hypothetical protein